MRSLTAGRPVSLALTILAAAANSGCPELNRQPDHAADPMFNVEDPAGRNAETAPLTSTGATLGPTQFMLSQQGGLPDQARRAH